MKVLSIQEPFAALIRDGQKCVETRSFKTNYRGELYIHASSTKMTKEVQIKFTKILPEDLPYGEIICKCHLVDCILMTKEYVEDMKKNHPIEYLCGDYQEGRYAWILQDIQVLHEPIVAKGQLGIWNYKNNS